MTALRVRVRGTVQGVGFRPFVARLAARHAVDGWIRNDPAGVEMELHGAAAHALVEALRAAPPPLARVEAIEAEPLVDAPAAPPRGFRVFGSAASDAPRTELPPDTAPCEACVDELFTPTSRRHGYALLCCTDCGPRATVIRGLPYDRARTSLAAFPRCAACAADDADPTSRFFGAETAACPACGPRLSHAPGEVAGVIAAGGIVALQGLGGFVLLCDATRDDVVRRLRARKRREAKPFAVLVPNLATARAVAHVDRREAEALTSPRRPIVLVAARAPAHAGHALAPSVAPGLRHVGLVLPSTPLAWLAVHAALGAPARFDRAAREARTTLAWVMTSANLSGAPILIDPLEARRALADVADLVVTHDRAIVARADDGVVQVLADRARALRRARGDAPTSVALGAAGPPTLALGAELKNTVALTRGARAFVSVHVGDLDGRAMFDAQRAAIDALTALVGVAPSCVAHDLHPDAAGTRRAHRLHAARGLEAIPVQHHHAHVAATLAEHGLEGPTLGVALDGYGYGLDGGAWGGELLDVDGAAFTRLGHLEPLVCVGGDAAARAPARLALPLLDHLVAEGRLDARPRDALRARLVDTHGAAAVDALRHRARRPDVPTTTALGRWLDVFAALLVGVDAQDYEAEAPLRLEAACAATLPTSSLAPSVTGGVLAVSPIIAHALTRAPPEARVAHAYAALVDALVAWIVDGARRAGRARVALAGGCLASRVLTPALEARLAASGLDVVSPASFPSGDGGLALGQAWVAARVPPGATFVHDARRARYTSPGGTSPCV